MANLATVSKSDATVDGNSVLEIINLLLANKNTCLTFANHWKTYFSEAKHLNNAQIQRYLTFASDLAKLLPNSNISKETAELFLKQHGKIVADLALKYGLDALASQNFFDAIAWLKVTDSLSQFDPGHFAQYYLQMAQKKLQTPRDKDDDNNDAAKKTESCIISAATP